MSGIVGIYNLDGKPVERTDVKRMVATLGRRGPDGSELWCEGAVGLGHTMLWNTPESLHEHLPLVNARGDTTITTDARIDNRDELIHILGFGGRDRRQIGDSELILTAYEKWGEECPARLVGDFAFAIWDGRRQILFCARDHFGVKPFCYYHRQDRVFVFASQLRALLALQQVPRQINEGRIADYLVGVLEGIDNTSTLYQEVYRHPPAHTLTVGSGSFSARRYWSLDPTREVHYNSDGEYTEAFGEIFSEAVRCRMRSASPPGFMMSGGMDSTSIVGVARQLAAKNGSLPIHTFSAISADKTDIETRNILAMHRMDGLQGMMIRPDQLSSFVADFDDFVEQSDDLMDNWIIHVPLTLYTAARRRGVRIILDGVPGDNVVSQGTGYITFLLRTGKWRTAVTEAVGISRLYHPYYPLWKTLFKSARAAFAPAWGRRLWRKIRPRNKLSEAIKDTIIDPDFANSVDVLGRLEIQRKSVHPAPPKTIRETQFNNLNAPYITAALERYDRVAAMHSIEARHPFMDRRLVEFCLALPWTKRMHRGRSKIVLRDATAGLIPKEVLSTQYCYHLGPQFSHAWFTLMQEYIEEVVHNHLRSEYVDVEEVKQAFRRCLSQPTSIDASVDDWWCVWQAVTLATWLKREDQ